MPDLSFTPDEALVVRRALGIFVGSRRPFVKGALGVEEETFARWMSELDLAETALAKFDAPVSPTVLTDLIERLERAEAELSTMARQERDDQEAFRLSGKAEGVGLALSYAQEYLRGAS